MKNKDLALLVAGIIFTLMALMHLIRLTYQTVVFFGPFMVPMWMSLLGFVIATFLALWMFRVRGR